MKRTVRIPVLLALIVTAVACASCSLRPVDLPIDSAMSGDGYQVTLQFASALNLPTGSDVTLDGIRIGSVRDVTLAANAVNVHVRVQKGTRIPQGVRAAIRQNTVLGDSYVALEPPGPGGGTVDYLGNGAVVPLSRTSSPPQLEDTLAILAFFVNGGTIQRAEKMIAGVNRVMPTTPEIRQMATTVAIDLADLSQNTTEIDRVLAGFTDTARAVTEKSADVQEMMNPAGMYYWHRIFRAPLSYLGSLLPAIGSIFSGGAWLIPMITSLADLAGAGRQNWDDAPAAADTLRKFLDNTLVPYLQDPSVNVRSVSASGSDLTADAEDLLRMLGAVQ